MRGHTRRTRRALRGAAVAAFGALAFVACDSETAPPFEVEGQGTISGLLYYDEGRDGVFEPLEGDFALADVPLHLTVRGTGDVIPGSETVTDADGRFTITDVPIGTHDIVFDSDALDDADAIICNAPREISVRIQEVTGVTISGQESCLITIAEARELGADEPVTVRGVVTVATGNISGSYFWMQDETAGAKIFISAPAVQEGDFIEVSGLIEFFSGEFEISRGSITVLGTAPLPDPQVISGEQFASHEFQGSLVTVEGLEVTEVATGDDYNVTVDAPDGTSFIVRVDVSANIEPGTFVVGNVYNVTGVVGPFGGAEQLYVRSQADIEQVS